MGILVKAVADAIRNVPPLPLPLPLPLPPLVPLSLRGALRRLPSGFETHSGILEEGEGCHGIR